VRNFFPGSMIDLLFVYGTLLRAAEHHMHPVLACNSTFIAEAHFNGRLYLVAHYPGAVAAMMAGERVHGEVYRLHDAAGLLAVLDDYEACAPSSPQPHEYVRRPCQVMLADDTRAEAWVYLYNRPVDGLPRILSGRFLEHMAAADLPD
jgi:gamma-glutamylcyclotransferase (GGCT)/AIG2-like uncharacterized protein YtfP